MNAWKRSLALLLAFSLLCATFSSSVFAVDAGCGDCGNCPTIVVHGIGQSKVSVTDPTGAPLLDRNGSAITRWPIYIDGASLALQLVSPLLRTLITQRDAGLTEKVYQAGIGLLKYSLRGGRDTALPLPGRAISPFPGIVHPGGEGLHLCAGASAGAGGKDRGGSHVLLRIRFLRPAL